MADTAIICVGNPTRSDDGLGPIVADELNRRRLGVPIHLSDGEPGELLELWSRRERVVVVDAVVTGLGDPGTIHVLDAAAAPLPIVSRASSHGIGLAESIELGRSLHRLPADLWVVGVEAASFEPGTRLSPGVRAAVPRVVTRVIAELQRA